MPVFYAIILTIILSIVGVLGDFFINLSGEGKKMDVKWFVIGFLIYASTAFGWYFAMKYAKLSTLGVFYAVTTALGLTLMSVLYFHESLTVTEGVGIFIALIALVLLGRFA